MAAALDRLVTRRQAPSILERPPQHELDLAGRGTELIRGPPLHPVVHGRIDSEEDRLALYV
jgi:hypothetical protein